MPGKGKRLAILSGGLGLLVVAALLVVSRDRIREEWGIYRLSSSAPEVRGKAIRTLAGLRSTRVIEALVRLHKEGREERAVLEALVEIGPHALSILLRQSKKPVNVLDVPRGITVLTECLSDPDDEVRFLALVSIRDMTLMGLQQQVPVEVLEVIVAGDPDPRCRALAAVLMPGDMPTRAVRRALLEGLRCEIPWLRAVSVQCLFPVDPEPLLAVSFLPLLLDPEEFVRCRAWMIIEEQVSEAFAHLRSPLEFLLPDRHMHPEDPAILQRTMDDPGEDHLIRVGVAVLLSRSDHRDAKAVLAGQLIPALEGYEVNPVFTEAAALLGSDGRGLAPKVVGFLDPQKPPEVNRQILEILDKIGSVPAYAAPKITTFLGDPALGSSAERALRAIGPAGVPAMIEALRKDDVRVIYHAARVLGALGPAARDAAPALRAVLPGCDPILGAVVEEALRRIEDR